MVLDIGAYGMHNGYMSNRLDREAFDAIECGRIDISTLSEDVQDWYYGVKAGRLELKGL